MNGAHLHLIVNHVPVLGAFAATVLLAVAARWPSVLTARYGYCAQLLTGASGIVAYVTGLPAQDAVARIPGISADAVGVHLVTGIVALIAGVLIGLLAVIPLYLDDVGARRPVLVGFLLLSVFVDVAMTIAANAGGVIRHTEIL